MSLSVRLSLAAAFLGVVASAASAHAGTVTLDVTAQLEYGGTLSGTLTFSSTSMQNLTSWDLTTTESPGAPGFTFAADTDTTANSYIYYETKSVIEIYTNSGSEVIDLSFANPLTQNGGQTLTTAGYEDQLAAGTRSTTSGSVSLPAEITSTPEPSSLLLLGTGILSAAGMMRRRFLKA